MEKPNARAPAIDSDGPMVRGTMALAAATKPRYADWGNAQ